MANFFGHKQTSVDRKTNHMPLLRFRLAATDIIPLSQYLSFDSVFQRIGKLLAAIRAKIDRHVGKMKYSNETIKCKSRSTKRLYPLKALVPIKCLETSGLIPFVNLPDTFRFFQIILISKYFIRKWRIFLCDI